LNADGYIGQIDIYGSGLRTVDSPRAHMVHFKFRSPHSRYRILRVGRAAPCSQQLNATSRLQQHALPSCLPALSSCTSTPLVFCIRISDLKPKDNADLNSLTNLLNELLYTAHRLVAEILYLHPVVFWFESRTVQW
jgi:hypothetical protein